MFKFYILTDLEDGVLTSCVNTFAAPSPPLRALTLLSCPFFLFIIFFPSEFYFMPRSRGTFGHLCTSGISISALSLSFCLSLLDCATTDTSSLSSLELAALRWRWRWRLWIPARPRILPGATVKARHIMANRASEASSSRDRHKSE